MTWTYDEAPDTSTADGRRDFVRALIGDTDSCDERISDELIAAFLADSGNDVYRASALSCRALAAKFAALTRTEIDSVKIEYQHITENYRRAARELDEMSKTAGTGGLGVPIAGGTSKAAMETENQNTDRVEPFIKLRQFANPPGTAYDDFGAD